MRGPSCVPLPNLTAMSSSEPPPLSPGVSPEPARPVLTFFLSLLLFLFLGSAIISLLDYTALHFFHSSDLSIVNALALLPLTLATALIYALMALVPAIPRRVFVPLCLFNLVAYIAVLPLFIYYHRQANLIAWGVSFCQVLLALGLLHHLHGGWNFRWPLFPASQFTNRASSFGSFITFVLGSVALLLPALVLYTAFSAQLAVSHFSDGFVSLKPAGLSMQMRKYVRDDGRQITLVPMMHIGEPEFYRDLSASFSPDSVILMEGVTDQKHVVTGHLDYSRMAKAAGGVQQVAAFKPPGKIVPADVDMSSFSAQTLELLKAAMLFHSKGITPETLPILMKPTQPGFEVQLIDDILTKRNRHLLEVIQENLPTSKDIIVPWGAAHMPEIAREIKKDGFRMRETREFLAIRFGS